MPEIRVSFLKACLKTVITTTMFAFDTKESQVSLSLSLVNRVMPYTPSSAGDITTHGYRVHRCP